MPLQPVLLKTSDLTKTFRKPFATTVLKNIRFEVRAGTSVAIGGRSGEGKSTLLQICGTLDSPTSGSLEIHGTQVNQLNKCALRNRHIGFVFQSYYLLGDFSTLDNVLMAARIARQPTYPGSAAHKRAVILLEKLGLSHRLDHSTKLLSGGEKQRVAIARALCNDPSIILADEPTGNLDKQTAEGIYNILLNTVREEQKALILVTHDLTFMERCDERYILSQGQLNKA